MDICASFLSNCTNFYFLEKFIFFAFLWYTGAKKYWHPYSINTIEMRSPWTEIKYIKSAARVLERDCVNKGALDLSKVVLWVSIGQRAADQWAVRVEGQRKILLIGQDRTRFFRNGPIGRIFLRLPTLTARRSAALETHRTFLKR